MISSAIWSGIYKHEYIFQRPAKVHEPLGRVHFVPVLIYSKLHDKNHVITYTTNIHEKHTSTTNFDSARVFSSFIWLAETDYYLCQIQTFKKTNAFKIIQLRSFTYFSFGYHEI